MFGTRLRRIGEVTDDLLQRIQRLEKEHFHLLAQPRGDREVRIMTAQIASAAQAAPTIGAPIEKWAESDAAASRTWTPS